MNIQPQLGTDTAIAVLSRTQAVLWSLSEVAMAEGQEHGRAVDSLLGQVARGDVEAMAAVCNQVAGPVYGLVSRIVGDKARSEQVTEQVLLEVWRTASRFDPAAGSGLAWIIALAQRHAVRHAGPAGSWDMRRRSSGVAQAEVRLAVPLQTLAV